MASNTFTLLDIAVPFVDIHTGQLNPVWYRFLMNQFVRGGGAVAPTNNELSIELPEDAGIEELKASLYAVADRLDALPTAASVAAPDQDFPPIAQPPLFPDPDTGPEARIAALEAAVAALSTQIAELQQGTSL
ncbi:hypothetical protein [Ralstonia thomasii]